MDGARCFQYEFDENDNPSYIGQNLKTNPSDDALDWEITKFTWEDADTLTKKQIAFGSWTDRATYFA
jgi:hypothetical protein